jgi:methylenetetrahydrofolate reductase (NADPH)
MDDTAGALPESASRLQRRLAAGRFVVTAELTPPLTADPTALLAKARPLRGVVDAVNVTDGASARTHMAALAASALMARDGIEPILQMTCRDRNRIALQSDLLGAVALGIRNIMVLTGDDPKAGDQPDAKAVFDVTSRDLIATAARMRDEGVLPTGRTIAGPVPLFIGAADAPLDPKPGWQPASLIQKRDAGAGFVQTQFCMDLGVLRRYLDRLGDAGLLPELKVLVGIAPIASAKSARWMREKLFGTIIPDAIVERLERAGDPRAEGKAICVELLHGLRATPGVAGAHLMAPLNEAAIPEVVAAAGLTDAAEAS